MAGKASRARGGEQGAGEQRVSPYFLSRMKIDSFGAFANRTIGPFEPGLNVVYGKNEAGKTTLSAFFGGVLFGWEEARGLRNTYKPSNAERAGSLFFSDTDGGKEQEFSRIKNTDGLVGDTSLVDDIDKETFSTMFSLTSDELRSLRNTTDVTAKLLTAGSGTGASPAHTLAELQDRIASYVSKASGNEHSLLLLEAQQEELRAKMAEAASEAERLKHQDKEFHELTPQRDELMMRLEDLNSQIEQLSAYRSTLDKLDGEQEKRLSQKEALLEDEKALESESLFYENARGTQNKALRTNDEFVIRDRLDVLAEECSKSDHSLDLAKENYASSKALYEALLEADDVQELERRAKQQRKTQIVLSICLPLLFVVAGIPVFIHGRDINSLSFTALGICLILFALLLAGAALVMLFRPNKAEEALTQRKKDAQWVMLQDRKKLESCEEDLHKTNLRIGDYLDSIGLQAAQGSLRRARIMLDEMNEARGKEALVAQNQQALVAQLSEVEEALADIGQQRRGIFEALSLDPSTPTAKVEALIEQKVQQRYGLMEASENVNRRYGELKQVLSQAEHLKRLDAIKLAYQQVRTRQKESSQDFARLLLAKRMLEATIGSWESKSQPEVYQQASRLFSLMTAGRWVQVRMSPEGRLQVVDEVKTVREPVHLSLGTCQQLYLSLRIALLMTAENVGRMVPIMADDILVNFDAERRHGAVKALVELAEKRQVIIFTCHEEVVSLIESADPKAKVLEL